MAVIGAAVIGAAANSSLRVDLVFRSSTGIPITGTVRTVTNTVITASPLTATATTATQATAITVTQGTAITAIKGTATTATKGTTVTTKGIAPAATKDTTATTKGIAPAATKDTTATTKGIAPAATKDTTATTKDIATAATKDTATAISGYKKRDRYRRDAANKWRLVRKRAPRVRAFRSRCPCHRDVWNPVSSITGLGALFIAEIQRGRRGQISTCDISRFSFGHTVLRGADKPLGHAALGNK